MKREIEREKKCKYDFSSFENNKQNRMQCEDSFVADIQMTL